MPARAQSGLRPLDAAAQARAEAHLPLAEWLAWCHFERCGRSVPLEELRGEAQLGLTYAASLYDPAKAVPFRAYAMMVVSHRLVQAVACWQRGNRLDQVCFTDLLAAEGSLDGPALDSLCPLALDPGRIVAARELLNRIKRSMPRRWFSVLARHYSFGDTLEEIGRDLGLSGERVCQILSQAVRRARRHCLEDLTD